jgi:hypothetical protein
MRRKSIKFIIKQAGGFTTSQQRVTGWQQHPFICKKKGERTNLLLSIGPISVLTRYKSNGKVVSQVKTSSPTELRRNIKNYLAA